MTPALRLAFVDAEAQHFAVAAWHYSRSLPASSRIGVGVWEADHFIGCVIVSRGACQHIGRPFGLRQTEVAELTRIALGPHLTPTSRVLSIAVRLLRRHSPGLRLLVSFADPAHGHDGRGVYAAAGWTYAGLTHAECLIRLHGRLRHPRSVGSRYGTRDVAWLRAHVDAEAERIRTVPKHRYLLPLDDAMRQQVTTLAQPYPTRPKEQAPAFPAGLGSATLTRPLHLAEALRV